MKDGICQIFVSLVVSRQPSAVGDQPSVVNKGGYR